MTNLEKLKEILSRMNEKDMAKFIERANTNCEVCAYEYGSKKCDDKNCIKGITKFLKQKYEPGKGD